ncbi:MAG: collagen binding domain-containing protein [Armatimonadota bacterium]
MFTQPRGRRVRFVLAALLVACAVSASYAAGVEPVQIQLSLARTTASDGRITFSYVLEVSDNSILHVGESMLWMRDMGGVIAQGDALMWRNQGITSTTATWRYDIQASIYRTRFAYFDVVADTSVSDIGTVEYELQGDQGRVGTVTGPIPKSPSPSYAISGTVFGDEDNNGTYSSGDTVLPDVTIELLNSADVVIAQAVTNLGIRDDNGVWLGNYRFSGLSPGDYRVRAPATISTPGGQMTIYTPQKRDVTITDASVTGVDFGYVYGYGTLVGGTVFLDANRNGVFEADSETRLADIEIELVNAAGEVIATTTSLAEPVVAEDGVELGSFIFEGVASGEYTVRAPATVGSVGQLQITVPSELPVAVNSALVTGVDFGYSEYGYSAPASVDVWAYVFFDANGNGQFDGFEMALEGVDVTLSGGTLPATVPTDSGGLADFGLQGEGQYTATITDDGAWGLFEYWTATTDESCDLTITSDTQGPLVCYFGYRPDPDKIGPDLGDGDITGLNRTIGFWKHNVACAMRRKAKGAQVTAAALIGYLAAVEALGACDEPFDLGSNKLAGALWYLHPPLSGNGPLARLDRQLLAAELNWVSGNTSSMPELERAILWWAEYVRNEDPEMAGELASLLDLWNNLGDASAEL